MHNHSKIRTSPEEKRIPLYLKGLQRDAHFIFTFNLLSHKTKYLIFSKYDHI